MQGLRGQISGLRGQIQGLRGQISGLRGPGGRTDGQTNESPLCSTGLRPLRGRCPASRSNFQPCKAGQRVSLTTYCPWATCFKIITDKVYVSAYHSNRLFMKNSKMIMNKSCGNYAHRHENHDHTTLKAPPQTR